MASLIEYTEFFDIQEADGEQFESTRVDFITRLKGVLRALDSEEEVVDEVCAKTWERMTEPQRHYHTPVHVLGMLGYAERAEVTLDVYEALALWFHDAIYATRTVPGYNESDSAGWMCVMLDRLGVPQGLTDQAAEAVRSTARHLEQDVPTEHHLLMDLDLAGLSASDGSFDRQSRAVRAEMAHMTDAEYAKATIGFFTALLKRERIYRTEAFDIYEAIARRHLHEQIEKLSAHLVA